MVKRRHKIIISKGDINNEPFQNKSSENQVEIFLLNMKGCVYLRVSGYITTDRAKQKVHIFQTQKIK